MADADQIPTLIQTGSNPQGIKKVQELAKRTMRSIGYVYPSKSCAAVLSHFLRESGIGVPVTTGAQNLADRLRINRKWERVKVGRQMPGDVGVCYSLANDVPGADHIYLVVERKDADLMMVADNQAQGKPHTRYASGKGGKTPTEYFLRAPGLAMLAAALEMGAEEETWPDEPTAALPELYMDDGSPRLLNQDGSPKIVD